MAQYLLEPRVGTGSQMIDPIGLLRRISLPVFEHSIYGDDDGDGGGDDDDGSDDDDGDDGDGDDGSCDGKEVSVNRRE
jgi:hypothetical protein